MDKLLMLLMVGIGGYFALTPKTSQASITRYPTIQNENWDTPTVTSVKDPYDPYRYAYWTTPPHGQTWDFTTNQAEEKYNLPAGILSAMARRESQYNPNATGAAGEQGMMQIIPKWHPRISDPFQPVPAIFYAGRILREYYDEFGDWGAALAAYNWGETNVKNYGIGEGMPTSTVSYMRKILSDIGIA